MGRTRSHMSAGNHGMPASDLFDVNNNQTARIRTKSACDACRSRKTKCFYHGSSCTTCLDLKIPCTQNRPRRRRGPRNQYVEAQRREQRRSFSSSLTPTFEERTGHGILRLASVDVVEQILNRWFDSIHALAPIFHRGVFMTRFHSREAIRDGLFAALVVSVCAATISSLRRKSHEDYGALTPERCWDVAEELSANQWRVRYSLDWCQMKYNLASSMSSTTDMTQHFRYISEAAAGVKYLMHFQISGMSHLDQQLLKRLYWLIFAAGCSADLNGQPYLGLLTSQDNVSAITPQELSDDEMDSKRAPQGSLDWHGHEVSYIPGLNYLSKLFLYWHQSQQQSPPTVANLQHYMNLVQRALDYLPPELIWRGRLSRPPRSNFSTDAQTVNLYITQLQIRSNILEQIDRLSRNSVAHESVTSNCVLARHAIVEDLLEILYNMPQETLEANGNSLIPKIRDVGSALFDEVRTNQQGEDMSEKARTNLDRLLAKLESLDANSQLRYLETGALPGHVE